MRFGLKRITCAPLLLIDEIDAEFGALALAVYDRSYWIIRNSSSSNFY